MELYNKPLNIELVSTIHTDSFSFNRNNYIQFIIKGSNKNRKYQLKIKVLDYLDKKETIKLNFEIPQGYYEKEELENYIKNNILKVVNTSINGYSSTEGNITIPLKI